LYRQISTKNGTGTSNADYFCTFGHQKKAMSAILYLIPTTLGESPIERVLPAEVCEIIRSLTYFVVENERTARRFLKRVDAAIDINALQMSVLDKDTPAIQKAALLKPLLDGQSIGIMSEAGCPGIADPGAELVELAHQKQIRIVPLVGPSSILLAMMASGMNGQSFAFNGYLPVKRNEKDEAVRRYELRSIKERQSQVFIEAPYRNLQLFDDLMVMLKPNTRLCIACDITLDTEMIITRTVAQWKGKVPDIQKRPAIFIIQG
jgi:16S rRNA (cytidine1402-2'-O)-methyltransferase